MRNHTLLNRRDALRSSLIGTAGVALSGNLLGKSMADPILHTNIDAHSHIWTTDLENYPLAQGQTVDDLKPASFTPEALLELAHANRVGRVVLAASVVGQEGLVRRRGAWCGLCCGSAGSVYYSDLSSHSRHALAVGHSP